MYKGFLITLSFLLLSITLISQGNITQAEYFWDTDPGAGNGTVLLALDGAIDEALEELFKNGIAVTGLSQGPHSFKVRVKGADGTWSRLFSQTIHIGGVQTVLTRDSKITQAEYFWDTDPGTGSGTALLALDGAIDEALEALFKNGIAVTGLSQGPHSFKVRVKGADGTWSRLFSQTIHIGGVQTILTRDSKITQAEYFWDTDPGAGSGTALLALDGTIDEALEELFKNGIAVTGLSQGPHSFKVRVKGADGTWSGLFSQAIYIDGVQTVITRDSKIIQAEYFWDTDPGAGNGAALLALDGTIDEALEELFKNGIAVTGLSQGPHSFKVRVKGVDGTWSSLFSQTIAIIDTNNTVDTTVIAQTICFGDTYTFGSQTLSVSGVYTELFTGSLGLDSVVSLTLTVSPALQKNISATICSGASYVFGSQTLVNSGIYSENYTTSSGCDSIVKLTLTVSPALQKNISATICSGASYVFGSQTLVNSGVYSEIFTSSSGCDSTVNLTLTVSPAIQHNITEVICSGESYVFGTQTLTTSGIYSENYTTSSGCDSTVNLTLTVSPALQKNISATICSGASYVFGSQTLVNSGIYSENYTTSSGCDSIVKLTLTVTPAIQHNITEVICSGESYVFGTQTLTTSGIYSENYTASSGCDSIVSLNLQVKSLPVITISYVNGEFTATEGLTYQWYLNGQIIVGETGRYYTPTVNGTYKVVVKGMYDCYGEGSYVLINVGVKERFDNAVLAVYPNPTKNSVTIESSEAVQISLHTISGGLLYREVSFMNKDEVDLTAFEAGVYILRLTNKSGITQHKRVVKQ